MIVLLTYLGNAFMFQYLSSFSPYCIISFKSLICLTFQASYLNNSDIDNVLELVYKCLHNLWVEQQLERINGKFDNQSSHWIVSLIANISEISQF